MLVFVEVKSRASDDYGPPEDAVDGRKQAKLRRIAQLFSNAAICSTPPAASTSSPSPPAPEGRLGHPPHSGCVLSIHTVPIRHVFSPGRSIW